jgi:hypothetical protein
MFMRRMLLFLSLCLLAVMAGAAPTPSRAEPIPVTVGTYINQISELNLRENAVTADFYIWFRWKGEGINPIETFEVVNGRIEDRQIVDRRTIGDMEYAQARVLASLNNHWDVRRFPLDRQNITLAIEDAQADTRHIVYVPDVENSAYNPNITIPGYHLGASSAAATINTYETNYGDPTLPTGNPSEYARYLYSMEIERPDWSYALKLFSTIFISAMVAFLAFLVKPTDLDPRFGLGVGALFAVVASTFVITSQLPDSDQLTLSDKINIAAMGMIFFSIIQSAVSLKLYESSPTASARLDTLSLIFFPIAYIGMNAYMMFG